MCERILRKFGQKVKYLRLQKNWTQEELAIRTGLHRTYIGSIERYERNVSLVNLQRIADAFEISIIELLDLDK